MIESKLVGASCKVGLQGPAKTRLFHNPLNLLKREIKWQHSLISVTFPQLHVQYSYSEKLKPLDTQAQSSSINVEELEMSLSTMGSRYGRARMKQEGGDTEMVDLT